MIDSAEQFRSLRESAEAEEYHRAAHEEAPLEVWLDILARMNYHLVPPTFGRSIPTS